MDGINSMTGNPPQLAPFLALAREHDALLYVDDAHGFGVVGERDRSETSPYGRRGNGVVRHLGEGYDHVVLTGGFSKAYSSLLAFVACPPELKRLLKVTAPPYLYSRALPGRLPGQRAPRAPGQPGQGRRAAGPALAADPAHPRPPGQAGGVHPEPFRLPDRRGAPGRPDDLARAGRFLLDRGIYVTLAFYPGVPRQEVGFRIQVTAANTDDQVGELLAALDRLADVAPRRAAGS
jgi:8-amino-7-oxononanoate synthase